MKSPFEHRDFIRGDIFMNVIGNDRDGVFETAEGCPSIGIWRCIVGVFKFSVDVEFYAVDSVFGGGCCGDFNGSIDEGRAWEGESW